MPTMDAVTCGLMMIDFQARLMPAICNGEEAVDNAGRLLKAARILDLPIVFTEQYPKGLGATVEAVAPAGGEAVIAKMTFDALRTPAVVDALPDQDQAFVVAGCEAHVCVLQTVIGLLDAGRRVFVTADAVGSRREDNRRAALDRMARHGAEIVTTEMVIFEWLASAEHPRFRDLVALIK